MRGRFAPSPTGDLHLGGAYVAIAAFLRSRAKLVLRMEDLDRPRVVAGAADRILDDLAWLGVRWIEGPRVGGRFAPYEQSARTAIYDAAVSSLLDRGLAYPCTCSRAEIARVASAPHAGEEGPRYPGTCRNPVNRRADRAAAIRLRVPDDATIDFDDAFAGRVSEAIGRTVGDFVLRRADGVASYQLAVVVDDMAMEIEEVVRGADLLSSTARQIFLARALGASRIPRYAHLPLVLGPDGERLAKRHQSKWVGSTIAELRGRGVGAEEVVGEIAASLGLVEDARPIDLDALLAIDRPIAPRAWIPPSRWLVAR